MGLNNVNTEAMGKFLEEAKADAGVAKKTKRVEGEWVFEEGKAQFRATLAFKNGERVVQTDLAPFMGGGGLAPDPVQYCLYGLAACYAGTFASVAAVEGVELRGLRVAIENRLDLARALGLSENPIVEGVEIELSVKSDAPREKLEEIKRLADERCPGVECLTRPIPLTTRLDVGE